MCVCACNERMGLCAIAIGVGGAFVKRSKSTHPNSLYLGGFSLQWFLMNPCGCSDRNGGTSGLCTSECGDGSSFRYVRIQGLQGCMPHPPHRSAPFASACCHYRCRLPGFPRRRPREPQQPQPQGPSRWAASTSHLGKVPTQWSSQGHAAPGASQEPDGASGTGRGSGGSGLQDHPAR